MPAVGLEPTRGCPQQILSLPRLPFRHAGMRFFNVTYLIIGMDELQVFFEKILKKLQGSFIECFADFTVI